MNRTRLAHVALALAAASAPILGASSAFAGTAHPDGYAVVEGCSTFSGQIQYTPGLTGTAHAQNAVLTGTLSGCHGNSGDQADSGSVVAVLSGTSTVNNIKLAGPMTVTWPASAGLNPSTANVSVSGTNQGIDTVFGYIASGPYTTGEISTSLISVGVNPGGLGNKKHPITSQQLINTAPFNALYNFG